MTNDADQRSRWQPPGRPEWVHGMIEEGATMDMREVVPLDERSLVDSAIRATGLKDFGADDWREPFQVFIKSLEDDAELNLVGRVWARAEILTLLGARLQVEETYKRHPEIADEQIRQPIIVIGQGRSGTSFLINLLNADPDNGAALTWENMYPCPPPEKNTYRTDPRIDKAERFVKRWLRVTPTIASMHEYAGNIPFEDCQLIALNFMSVTWLGTMGQAAGYDRYMMRQDVTPGLRYHQRVLKLLQWKNPRKHWVLKDPMHLDRMRQLLELYPDACFVWPHRDPVRALASMVSLLGTAQWGRSSHIFKGGSFEYMIDPTYTASRLDSAIDQIKSGLVPPRQMFNIQYRDLVDTPLVVIEKMYDHFGFPFDPTNRNGVVTYLSDFPRDSRPSHTFDLGTPEMVARQRQAYKAYQDYFNVPNE